MSLQTPYFGFFVNEGLVFFCTNSGLNLLENEGTNERTATKHRISCEDEEAYTVVTRRYEVLHR